MRREESASDGESMTVWRQRPGPKVKLAPLRFVCFARWNLALKVAGWVKVPAKAKAR